jgi:hypothetical protein
MSKANSNKRSDDDILRASDIIPPYKVQPAQKMPAEPTSSKQRQREIPRFDLAEEIMAEQRKVTAARRKSPNKSFDASLGRTQDGKNGVSRWQEETDPRLDGGQQQIIAEIVAKDITKLCEASALGQR